MQPDGPLAICMDRPGDPRRQRGLIIAFNGLRPDDETFAYSLPAGSIGKAGIFANRVKPAHVIRKVLLRQIAITDEINPF